MALTEQTIIKQITILPATGHINVQMADQVLKDGELISEKFHRTAYEPGDPALATAGITIDVNAFMSAFNAGALDAQTAAVAERDAAVSAKVAAEAARDAAVADAASKQPTIDALNAEKATHQSRIAELEAQLAAVPQTGDEVTMRQARLALLQTGKLQSVIDAIAAMPEPDKTAAEIEWNYSNTVARNHAFTKNMMAALGMTELEGDQLFALAKTL